MESVAVTERSVLFENAAAGVSLSGTLTVPAGGDRFPAVVLIHGQGPVDRDMSLAHLKPYRVLAEHLASRGIASLRYDKRGVGASGGDFGTATRQDLADDASAALLFLRDQESILVDRIGLLGQSEGGLVAPMVAARHEVAFVVLLAGPAVSGRENLGLSLAMFAEASSRPGLEMSRFKRDLDRLLDLTSPSSLSAEDRNAAIRLATSVVPHAINARTRVVFGGADITAEQFVDFLSSSCLRETLESRPEIWLSRLTCPVLALFAARDRHVPARENQAALERCLEAAGNRDSTVETIAGCNHLFQRCETGYPDEYFTIGHDIRPEVLEKVSDWIRDVVRRAAAADVGTSRT